MMHKKGLRSGMYSFVSFLILRNALAITSQLQGRIAEDSFAHKWYLHDEEVAMVNF